MQHLLSADATAILIKEGLACVFGGQSSALFTFKPLSYSGSVPIFDAFI